MTEQPQSLRSVFTDGETKRKELESSWDTNSATFQENLTAAITAYEECLRIADRVSLFSPNETLEDIASGDLQYLLLNYYVAELLQRVNGGDRKALLLRARAAYERLLKMLDQYDILSPSDTNLYEKYRDDPGSFSTASKTDPSARRETKISRFREEKDLKKKLEYLRQTPTALQNDEAALRDLLMTNITLCTHRAFQSLESIAQELQILSLAPPPPLPGQQQPIDDRQRNGRNQNGYSDRLDAPLSQLSGGLSGPILSKDGKPLRPFTLLDTRQTVQDGVFRPDHSLPTMTIDEYLEEEKKRGGMISGGGEQSGIRPEPDEDNIEKADEETLKARAWDEFKEDNPKGSGNTLNRG
ncbi:type 2A phosphatase-associated protein 42 [Cryomyces antarcticus]|uniref:Type 2A phosphatase-associated protein 42 n=1 Tax=Cryomyces antarcticus TaxID=329879 RepID=A0ABR0LZZ5_9PEZI|nr:hypothetical protein LTR04_001082 [Oleoguttula sp. CCFEE 6159]KAK5257503.1 Type 2A phosphatase-associated protein 42 [Cryomyces antarcticus]